MAKNPKPIRQWQRRANRRLRVARPTEWTQLCCPGEPVDLTALGEIHPSLTPHLPLAELLERRLNKRPDPNYGQDMPGG
jgi:hypothetical protein